MAREKNGDFTANSGLIDYWDVYFSWLPINCLPTPPTPQSNGPFQTSALQQLDLVLHAFPLLGIRRCILLLADDGPFLGEFGVELLEVFLTRRDFFLGVDGLDRALGVAPGAIDARVAIDDQKVRALVETVDRTDLDTVHVFALSAAFRDHERHDLPFSY